MTDSDTSPLVLIADDDRVTRAIVSSWLSSAGFTVLTAHDGGEALKLAAQEQPDLLLVDVTMPGTDGYDVCRSIQVASTAPPPVIFLTAHTTTRARVAGLDAGAVDYIVKPFEAAELLARVRAALRTKAARDGLAERATRDGLTGLLNRAETDLRAEAAVQLAERHKRPLSCLLVDIDNFKAINDGYGHAAGDAVIREVSHRIQTACRLSDITGRYGGEEFILLLPETRESDALTTGDKIRRVVSEHAVPVGRLELFITASVGVAQWSPTMDRAALYSAADQALYKAKENGRNRTEVYGIHLRPSGP